MGLLAALASQSPSPETSQVHFQVHFRNSRERMHTHTHTHTQEEALLILFHQHIILHVPQPHFAAAPAAAGVPVLHYLNQTPSQALGSGNGTLVLAQSLPLHRPRRRTMTILMTMKRMIVTPLLRHLAVAPLAYCAPGQRPNPCHRPRSFPAPTNGLANACTAAGNP